MSLSKYEKCSKEGPCPCLKILDVIAKFIDEERKRKKTIKL